MVQNVVVEAVRRQDVALVVGLVERPVVAQAFGAEHQHAVIAQFAVLDDGQGLKGFAKAHAVRNDAPAKAFQLVDGTHHAVTLELVELLPHHGVANAGGGFDDAFLVHAFAVGCEKMLKHQCVYARGIPVRAQFFDRGDQCRLGFRLVFERTPLHVEPLAQHVSFCRILRCLNQAEWIAGGDSKAFRAESEGAQHRLLRRAVVIAQDHGSLWNGARCVANLCLGVKPR